MKMALKYCLEENRILYPIKPVFEQLYRNLMTQRDKEESLRIFHSHWVMHGRSISLVLCVSL